MTALELIFDSHFHKASGAKIEGVALGIAGDTAPNVLWRLMHGEMPDFFAPKVWWLSLGNNDLGRTEVRFLELSGRFVSDVASYISSGALSN